MIRLLKAIAIASTLILSLETAFGQPEPVTPPPATPIYVILKLDDLTGNSPAWIRTVDYLKEKNVKSAIGIICKSLEKDRKPFEDWVKGVQKTGLVEFWNHGYDHATWKEGDKVMKEFRGPSYEQQKEHLTKSQQLSKAKLGITMHTFGAPFNGTDAATLKALGEDPDLKVFLYGNPRDAAVVPDLMIMERTQMNIENPLFVPNEAQVEHDYNILSKTKDLFVIQGHPNQWDAKRFEEFKKLVEFLISKNVVFTTPYEYYSQHPKEAKSAQTSETMGTSSIAKDPK